MTKARLVLVRHGATIDNQAGRLMGRNDAPLAEDAKKGAKALGRQADVRQYLQNTKTIWASPLPRAFDTARLMVGDRDITIKTTNALIERDFGIYNGRLLNELWESDPEWKLAEGGHTVRPLNGESLADVEMRVFPFLTHLHKTVDDNQHLIVVGHSTVWRLVAAALNKRRKFPLEEKIAGPLSVQVYPRYDIELLLPIIDELTNVIKDI
jgi:broad specificity phosphatase PhoE